jgi:hypothetical protein
MNWQIDKIVSDREEKEVEETIKLRKILTNIDLPGKIKCKLNTAELVELCRDVKYCFRRKGDRVCTEGEKDDRMYLILRGRAQLSVSRVPGKLLSSKSPGLKSKYKPEKSESVVSLHSATDREIPQI